MSSTPDNRSPRRAWTDWLVIVAFAVLLWLPTLDYFTHVDITQPPEENRLLAAPPHLAHATLAEFRNYLTATEAYFNDHFGFRKRLIRWCHQWKERLYRSKSGNLVVGGQNGWLYCSERRMIDHFLGTEQFTPEQLRSWQRLLEKRRDWLAARGIQYLFVVPPDKQDIYPENLPAWLLAAAPTNRVSKLDQFLTYMKSHSTVEIVDLRPSLIAGKRIAPTYLQNDSHWNFLGGFLAGQQVIQALAPHVAGIAPLRLEDFNWTNQPTVGGDLATLLGTRPAEKNHYAFTPKPPLVEPQRHELTNIVRNWFPYDTKKVNCVVENPLLATNPVDVVVFHDSFACVWWQVFGYSFHRTVFVWENHEFNTRIITQNHPKIVVNEIVERFFNTEEPDEMITRDALP